MTEAEKQTIEKLHNGKKMDLISIIRTFKREGIEKFVVTKKETVETVLNLIEKQQAEIELSNKVIDKRNEEKLELASRCFEKDKIIDLIAQFIWEDDTIFRLPDDVTTPEEVKEYFKKKVEEK